MGANSAKEIVTQPEHIDFVVVKSEASLELNKIAIEAYKEEEAISKEKTEIPASEMEADVGESIHSEFQRKFCWKRPKHDARDKWHAPLVEASDLPGYVDLRDNFPAVYEQGDLGSCVANAIGAAMVYQAKRLNLPDTRDRSRLFIYYNVRDSLGLVKIDSGSSMRDGLKTTFKWGACPESTWPYVIPRFREKPSQEAYDQAEKFKISEYKRVPQSRNNIRATLAAGNPVLCGIMMFAGIDSARVIRSGVVPMPKSEEPFLGGHAILLIGYDDTKEYYIFRNSWGERFGEKGYGYLPYRYIESTQYADDFWTITLVSESGSPLGKGGDDDSSSEADGDE